MIQKNISSLDTKNIIRFSKKTNKAKFATRIHNKVDSNFIDSSAKTFLESITNGSLYTELHPKITITKVTRI